MFNRGMPRMPRGGRGGRRGGRRGGGMMGGGGSMMRMISRRMMVRLIIAAVVGISAWFGKDKVGKNTGSSGAPTGGQQEGDFTVYPGARLASFRNNDGDSFMVSHNDQQKEYRLYFVDTPESKDSRYDDGKERIRDQGKDFGGLSYKETIKLGQEAKKFTLKALDKPFTVYATGELVFGGPREHAFIQISHNGEDRWLHEVLVEKGLGRIHTRGVETPEGISWKKQKERLMKMEKEAKSAGLGAWR